MIATNPDFINGDKLNVKQYLAALVSGKQLAYSSRSVWWRKSTQFWALPAALIDVAVFIGLAYHDWKADGVVDWLMLVAVLVVVMLGCLSVAWLWSYRAFCVKPQRIAEKLMDVITRYIPDAKQVRGISYTNYILMWKELEYELAYSLIPSVNKKGKVVNYQESVILCLHFMADPEYKSQIEDADGRLLDSFLDECYAYCQGKESCRMLRLEENTMFVFFRLNDLKQEHLLANAMEQMQYIASRFHLLPLYLSKSLGSEIQYWLQINDQPNDEGIVAFHIGICGTKDGYSLYLTGSRSYSETDDAWTESEDFVPEEKFLDMPMSNHTEEDWKEFALMAKATVKKYLELKADDEGSLFYHKIVTIQANKGPLERLQ